MLWFLYPAAAACLVVYQITVNAILGMASPSQQDMCDLCYQWNIIKYFI